MWLSCVPVIGEFLCDYLSLIGKFYVLTLCVCHRWVLTWLPYVCHRWVLMWLPYAPAIGNFYVITLCASHSLVCVIVFVPDTWKLFMWLPYVPLTDNVSFWLLYVLLKDVGLYHVAFTTIMCKKNNLKAECEFKDVYLKISFIVETMYRIFQDYYLLCV